MMANEKRLIDANALCEKLADKALEAQFFDECEEQTIKECMAVVQQMATVDAVEVVHSQWDTVFYERNGTLASYSHLCPECKYFYRDVRFKGHNYCPNCGAKMDGGKDNG